MLLNPFGMAALTRSELAASQLQKSVGVDFLRSPNMSFSVSLRRRTVKERRAPRLHLLPLPRLGALEDGVAHFLRLQRIAEGRAGGLAGLDAFDEVGDLVDE